MRSSPLPVAMRFPQLILLALSVQFSSAQINSTLLANESLVPRLAAKTACTHLQTSLGSTVVQSSGAEYTESVANTWNFLNAELHPTCIVFPRNSVHVQAAMKAIYDAKSNYAVQAGAHSAMKGWNNVQDGVLILFSHMKNASYDPVKDTITLEPGIHWDEALAALEPQGVAPVGGGGLSFLSPSNGYAADNFKELDVVLVTGELVTVTATNTYADLFRALKGGGNRFGIVTRYELYPVHTGTRDDKNYFGGLIVYNSSSADALLKATARYVREVNDPKAVLLVFILNNFAGTDGDLSTTYATITFYNGPELPTEIFGEFLSIPAIASELAPMSYLDASAVLGSTSPRGFVQHYGASALYGDEDLYLDAFQHWSNFSTAFKDILNLSTLAFTPIPVSQINAGRQKGGNIINPPGRRGFAAIQLAQQFDTGIQEISADAQRGIDLLFKQIPPSPGLPLYLGESDLHQEVFASYGDYELLKKTYAKYDPTRFNVEHTQGPIGL
ncbi:hypothetical protein B0H10DRAFT_2042344 [Mycena sp. CBHHK59/15]|nr:hypothetical protein B0H10DRAFT_2042344 [Mycena sp. CBHHK59/15]